MSKKILGWLLANVFVIAGLIAGGAAGVQKIRGDIEHLQELVDEYGKAGAIRDSDLTDRVRYLERLRMGAEREADEEGAGASGGDHGP